MDKTTAGSEKNKRADARRDRLKSALKANLKRRKAQAKIRTTKPPEAVATKD